MEYIVKVDLGEFILVVLEVLRDENGCLAINRCKAVNFVHIPYQALSVRYFHD